MRLEARGRRAWTNLRSIERLADRPTSAWAPALGQAGRVRLWYYLKNEGVGPALDVEHGVSIGGVESTVDDAGAR